MCVVVAVSDLGAGPVLDEKFDFRVDSRGDVDTDSGIDELAKDLSYNIYPRLEGFLGSIPSDTNEEIEIAVRTTIQSDPRVRTIRNLQVQHDRDGIAISADILSKSGSFTFVEEVNS